MNPLDDFLKNKANRNLPGFFSNSIKLGYDLFAQLLKREPELENIDARNSYGYLRHVYIDIVLRHNILHNNDLDLKLLTNETSKNGHTYLLIEHKNCLITVNKTSNSNEVPVKAKNRLNRSYLNGHIPEPEVSLFESDSHNDSLVEKENEDKMYMIVSYGGTNYKISYIQMGLPNVGCTSWLYTKDITNASPAIKTLPSSEKQKIELEYKQEIKKTRLEREKKQNGGQV